MENKNELLKQRIQKGTEYFWNLKPSGWNPKEQYRLREFMKLVKLYLNGENVHITDLKEEPRGFEAAKVVFNEKAPVSLNMDQPSTTDAV